MTSATVPAEEKRRPGRPRNADYADGVQSRERILIESARLFRSAGYSATTTRDIALAVGVRQSSLFHHFARKDEILHTLLDNSLDAILDICRWMRPMDPDADVALWALIRHDTYVLCADPINVGNLIRLPEARGAGFEAVHRKRAELERSYGGFVKSGCATGLFVDRDPALLTNLLFSLIEGTIDWYRPGGRPSAEKSAVEVADSALRMIITRQARLPRISKLGADLLARYNAERVA